jgi:hypothetical protein
MKKIRIDGAQVISNEMHSFETKKAIAKASLGFPSLITAICIRARVPNMNPTPPIEPPMDKAYIRNHCTEILDTCFSTTATTTTIVHTTYHYR